MATPQYTIHLINLALDYPTLTTLSLSAFTSNPLHYLTFRSPLPPSDEIIAYHRATRIEIADEGNAVRTFKVVESFPPDSGSGHGEDGDGGRDERKREGEGEGKIVAFASWVFDSSWPRGKVEDVKRPEGMDMRFLNDFREKVEEVKRGLGDMGDCIGNSLPISCPISYLSPPSFPPSFSTTKYNLKP